MNLGEKANRLHRTVQPALFLRGKCHFNDCSEDKSLPALHLEIPRRPALSG